MINIADLESRWIKFKIKSYIPHAVIVISLVIILVLFLTLSIKDTKEDKIKLAQNSIKKVEQVKIQQKEKEKTIKEPIQEKKIEKTTKPLKTEDKMVLSPSLNFIKDMQNNTLAYYENEDKIVKNKQKNIHYKKTIHTTKTQLHKKENKINTIKQKLPKQEIRNSVSINVSRETAQEDINQVIKRFKVNNNPALSLFIAKKYYELGEYNKSYNYALITNEINSNIEASWIIFTKSLVKLNEKDMAIKTLRTYYNHSNSNKAKILLDEIITGKFK